MLTITIPAIEQFDEVRGEFFTSKACTLKLEHSLVSISKWEARWCKPFLVKTPKTVLESLDYIRCMTITQNVDPSVYNRINNDIMDQVSRYIQQPMTATTFNNRKGGGNHETYTSEIIYYWMIALNIPFECQKWHLNRLLTLIDVCNLKNQPQKKMSAHEIMERNNEINAARRKALHTSG